MDKSIKRKDLGSVQRPQWRVAVIYNAYYTKLLTVCQAKNLCHLCNIMIRKCPALRGWLVRSGNVQRGNALGRQVQKILFQNCQ